MSVFLASDPGTETDTETETETTTIFQLGYASAACRSFTTAELDRLLASSRARNEELGVTGLLLYHEGSFLQILEGDETTVDALYRRISADSRHTNPLLLFRRHDEERRFPEWTMGFGRFDEATPAPPGFDRFIQTGFAGLTNEDCDMLRNVLFGFRNGRWHPTAG